MPLFFPPDHYQPEKPRRPADLSCTARVSLIARSHIGSIDFSAIGPTSALLGESSTTVRGAADWHDGPAVTRLDVSPPPSGMLLAPVAGGGALAKARSRPSASANRSSGSCPGTTTRRAPGPRGYRGGPVTAAPPGRGRARLAPRSHHPPRTAADRSAGSRPRPQAVEVAAGVHCGLGLACSGAMYAASRHLALPGQPRRADPAGEAPGRSRAAWPGPRRPRARDDDVARLDVAVDQALGVGQRRARQTWRRRWTARPGGSGPCRSTSCSRVRPGRYSMT